MFLVLFILFDFLGNALVYGFGMTCLCATATTHFLFDFVIQSRFKTQKKNVRVNIKIESNILYTERVRDSEIKILFLIYSVPLDPPSVEFLERLLRF